MTLPATPPSIRTALSPSRYVQPSISTSRGRWAASVSRMPATPWMALTPSQPRALCARRPAPPGGAVAGAPPAPAVRPPARHLEDRAQGALATRLDLAVGGLEQDREVAVQPPAALARHPAEPVPDRLDLLVVVEDERQVVGGVGPRHAEAGGQPQHHRVAGLHVAGPAAEQPVAVQGAGHV